MTDRLNQLPEIPASDIWRAQQAWPAFRQSHMDAINTTIGVLLGPDGLPWRPAAVVAARQDALSAMDEACDYGYQTPKGHLGFLAESEILFLGYDVYDSHTVHSYQTLGGTGALSLTGEALNLLMRPNKSGTKSMVYDQGWQNHQAIFGQHFNMFTYDHLSPETGDYNHVAAMQSIGALDDGSAVLLQVGGYNDDGLGRTPQQWDEILDLAASKELIVIMDAAYVGLAQHVEADRDPIKKAIQRDLLTFVCVSNSKTMGLYNERLGALHIANIQKHMGDEQTRRFGQLVEKNVTRTVLTAPRHVAESVFRAMKLPDYYDELSTARNRLDSARGVLAEVIGHRLPAVGKGRGLFTKIHADGFTANQQGYLESEGIHVLPSSRINIGGIAAAQIERVGLAILRSFEFREH